MAMHSVRGAYQVTLKQISRGGLVTVMNSAPPLNIDADTHSFLALDKPLTLPAQTVAMADSNLRLSPGFPSATVLIVDDFAPWRAEVRRILAVRPEWKIVGEACDGLEAVQKATEFHPDIIVLDITMPGLNGIEAAKLIRQQSPKSAIIFLTMNDDQRILDAVFAVSSAGYVLKVNASRDLCSAITSRGTPFYQLAGADFQHRACDERYRIRRGRLADMEDDKAAPDIFQAKSFSKCYRVAYGAILQAFGVRLENSEDVPQGPTESGETTKQWSFADADRPFSLTFQSKISFDQTRLVTESAEELGVPAIVRQRL